MNIATLQCPAPAAPTTAKGSNHRTVLRSLHGARQRLPMALSAAVLLVAAASVLAQPGPGGPGGPGAHADMHHGGPHGQGMHAAQAAGPGFGPFVTERMLDRVKATPEQRAQIRKIMEAASTELRGHHDAARALRTQALQVYTQPSVDAAAAEKLRQQMLAQHDQASKRMMQAMLEASQVLSAEQRAKLGEDIKRRGDMMERHMRERRALDAPRS